MTKLSKRAKLAREKIDSNKLYSLEDSLKLLKETATAKFDESVDVAINLGVDPKKSDQVVRGSTLLPKGTGKKVRVAVFTNEKQQQEAKDAGADHVGLEDLAEEVKKGMFDFDVVIASPDAMPTVSKIGQVLGPKGLMPNPKVGTVASDIVNAVKTVKSGQVRYRVDKAGIIHTLIGKASFDTASLTDNLKSLVADIQKAKPSTTKGVYLKSVSLSTTMGSSVRVDISSI